MRYITRTIWVLSLVSLFTDTASEMLYPVMPLYLTSIGFSVLFIGILEGVAEAAAGLSKGYFGRWSDQSGRRLPFVQIGYGLSAVSKPLLIAFAWPLWVVSARTLDRLGKGIRTGARDALLSSEATPGTKATVFGFHRAMDTLGAVIGPSLGLLYLYFHPGDYKPLFLLAVVPGLLAVLATLLLRERRAEQTITSNTFLDFLKYWKKSPGDYRRIVTGFLAFALVNSSDTFLLLNAKQSGMDEVTVIGVYIFYNLVYAIFSFPLGLLADRIGIKKVYLMGLVFFAMVYAGMGRADNEIEFIALFFLYGMYAAASEGVSKAWITNIADPTDAATAVGTYAALQSICALFASILTGLLWYLFGPGVALTVSAAVAALVAVYFLVLRTSHPLE